MRRADRTEDGAGQPAGASAAHPPSVTPAHPPSVTPAPQAPRPGNIVISANTSWNIVNFRAGLIRALIADGFTVTVMSPPDRFSPQIEALGARYRPVPMDNKGTSPAKDLALTLRFWRALREVRPAAFLGYTIKPNIYGSLAAHALSIPTINNISGLGTAFIRETWLTGIVALLYRAALSRAHLVFFQNPDDRALFLERRLVEAARTQLVPGSGIDLEKFSPRPKPPREGVEGPVFLLIARLLWDKGVGEYVEAARMVRREHPRARFQLAGMLDVENPTAIGRADVDGWVAEGLIDYLGALDDVRPAIAAADCVVLPSYREGTPRTLLEAAAMARPTIATDVPGCREVVREGETGFLCRVRDAADLARRMQEFIEMPEAARLAMGEGGRRLAEERFDEGLVICAYREALGAIAVRR